VVVQLAFKEDEKVGRKPFCSKFEYLIHQNVVVVSTEGIHHPESVLVNLYPNDTGTKSPNPSNNFNNTGALQGKMEARAFKWAQWLAGLDFLPDKSQSRSTKYRPVETVMNQLKRRVQHWQALGTQLALLAKNSIPIAGRAATFPRQPITTLTKWEEVTKTDFYRHEEGWKVEEGEVRVAPSEAESEDTWQTYRTIYFRALFKREKVQLQALVEISPEYPTRAPFFKLNVLQNKEDAVQFPNTVKAKADPDALKLVTLSSQFDNDLKNIETEINANFGKLLPSDLPDDNLLSYQLQKLQECFDIHCETMEHGEEMKNIKDTIRPVTGRGRSVQF